VGLLGGQYFWGVNPPKFRGVALSLNHRSCCYRLLATYRSKGINMVAGGAAGDGFGSRQHDQTFADHVTQLLARVVYRKGDSAEQREAFYRLRHDAYLREGAISADSCGTFSDAYDETDNAYLFGVYIDDQLASSLRLHAASKEHPHMPSLRVFPGYLQPDLDAGKVLIDSTHFVAEEHLSRLYRGLPYVTLRLCVLAAEHFRADYLFAAVWKEHQPFYRRAFNFQLISKPRAYPPLAKPFSLMRVYCPSAAEEWYRRYPFFRSSLHERRRLFEHRRSEAAYC
jgi:hypothetical protein